MKLRNEYFWFRSRRIHRQEIDTQKIGMLIACKRALERSTYRYDYRFALEFRHRRAKACIKYARRCVPCKYLCVISVFNTGFPRPRTQRRNVATFSYPRALDLATDQITISPLIRAIGIIHIPIQFNGFRMNWRTKGAIEELVARR